MLIVQAICSGLFVVLQERRLQLDARAQRQADIPRAIALASGIYGPVGRPPGGFEEPEFNGMPFLLWVCTIAAYCTLYALFLHIACCVYCCRRLHMIFTVPAYCVLCLSFLNFAL